MRALTAFVLIALASTSCGGSAPELRMAGDSSTRVGIALSNTPHHSPRSLGSMSLCLTASGTATISGVSIHDASGDIRVGSFAVRPSPFGRGLNAVGVDDRTLLEIGGGFAPGAIQHVSIECPSDAEMNDPAIGSRLNEFAVQVVSSSADVSGGTGIDVIYTIGGVEGTAFIPFAIWLCTGTCPDDIGS